MSHKADNTIKFLTRDLDITQTMVREKYNKVHGHTINKDRLKRLWHMDDVTLAWRAYYAEMYALDAAIEYVRQDVLGVDNSEARLLEYFL